MSEQPPLSAAEREAFARELVGEQLDITPAVASPKAVFTAGQPGSGKSMIVNSIKVTFEGTGAPAITIDPDNIRPDLPYMRDRIARGDLDIPAAAFSDAGTTGARMMELPAEGRRNIVYDGTLSNSFYAQKSIDYLKAREYRVEIHGMAVAPDLSHASTYDRREAQIKSSPTGFGRGVEDDFHHKAVSGLVDTIETLQAQGSVDAIVLHDRQGNIVESTKYGQGRWMPTRRWPTLCDAHIPSRIDAAWSKRPRPGAALRR